VRLRCLLFVDVAPVSHSRFATGTTLQFDYLLLLRYIVAVTLFRYIRCCSSDSLTLLLLHFAVCVYWFRYVVVRLLLLFAITPRQFVCCS